jgi:signal transduction histidine kinase
MLPEGTLHKRNGHHRHPTETPSPRALLHLVHSEGSRDSAAPSWDALRFAKIVQTEKLAPIETDIARELDRLAAPLATVLARTREAFARGELADVREALESFEARAREAARLVTRLAAATHQQELRHHIVDVNAVVVEALDRLEARPDAPFALVRGLEPELPRVLGHPGLLGQVVTALIAACERLLVEGGKTATVRVETSAREGVVRGEPIVQVRIVAAGAGLEDLEVPRVRPVMMSRHVEETSTGRALQAAAWIAAEHGGVVVVERLADGAIRFGLELSAV